MQLPPRQVFALQTRHQALLCTLWRQLMPPQPCVLPEGSSTGAASASANSAAFPPGFSAANLPTGTTFASAGVETDPSVAGAVSTDAALAPTSAAADPTGTNTAALAANAAPAAPVTNAAALSKSPSVGSYTAGTLGAMMHDCVKWVFTGQQALKQAQQWQTVLELAQPKRQNAHDAPSCPLSKFITTEAIQGRVIALTTTKITRQHAIVSFSQATACRQILWSDGPWTGGGIEHAWENYYESQGYKPTATCKECGFKKLAF